MDGIWTTLITGFFTVIVSLIGIRAESNRKQDAKYKDRQERRALDRAQESKLAMKMMNATMQLSIVSANALTNGHNNGNVERARKAAEEALKEYDEFIADLAAKELSKS